MSECRICYSKGLSAQCRNIMECQKLATLLSTECRKRDDGIYPLLCFLGLKQAITGSVGPAVSSACILFLVSLSINASRSNTLRVSLLTLSAWGEFTLCDFEWFFEPSF